MPSHQPKYDKFRCRLCCTKRYKQNLPDYHKIPCRSRKFRSKRRSCWLFPAECSQAQAQPRLEARRREAEWLASARSLPHRNIPAQSRKFDCRTGQYWFLNNRPNAVSPRRLGDCRSLHLIEPGLAPASPPECRCATCPRPTLRENELLPAELEPIAMCPLTRHGRAWNPIAIWI